MRIVCRNWKLGRRGLTAATLAPAACLLAVISGVAAAHLDAQGHAGTPTHARQEAHPGYLGVSLLDLDADTAARLHLKDTHGALIVTIDRDAPAATAGLRPRDVIVEVSGQRIDNVDGLRRKLRETSPGSMMMLRVSRDGVEQAISVQLGDEAEIARNAWLKHFSDPALDRTEPSEPSQSAGAGPPAPDTTFVAPKGRSLGKSFLPHFSLNPNYTGAELDPLSTQLADFFGVHDGAGLLVRSVNENSPASAAGLKAGDVILRVNNLMVVSREDWTRQLHANKGRPVQLFVMRNRHEQTMTMTAGVGKK